MLRAAALLAVLSMLCTVVVAWACALWSPVTSAPASFEIGKLPSRTPAFARSRANPEWLVSPQPWPPTNWNGTLLHCCYREYRGIGILISELTTSLETPGADKGGPDHIVLVQRVGWPWKAMECVAYTGLEEGQTSQLGWRPALAAPAALSPNRREGLMWPLTGPAAVPLGILPAGLTLDALVYAALLVAPLALVRARRVVRKRGNRCPLCGYALAGLPTGSACPECGQ